MQTQRPPCAALHMYVRLSDSFIILHGRYDNTSWAPPMSVHPAYRHQSLDNEVEEDRVPTPPLRGRSSSPATAPFSQPSSSSLSSAHHEEMQSILQAHLDELTRAYQYEVAKQAWYVPSKFPARHVFRLCTRSSTGYMQ